MNRISLEKAQEDLADLIEQLVPGEGIEITQGNQTLAKLIREKPQRQFGLGQGKLLVIQDDDSPLDDFQEYLS